MRIRGFRAVRPAEGMARDVASVPYDTVSRAEARKLADGKPNSFLRVARSDLEFDDSVDAYSDTIYERAKANFDRLMDADILVRDPDPAMFVYRQVMGKHMQRGIVCCSHVDDYTSGAIRKHEKTLKKKEDDRLRHIIALSANSGPVFLAYRDESAIDKIVSGVEAREAIYDFTAEDGIGHTVWRMNEEESEAVAVGFRGIPNTYIADGHHRAAAAARAAMAQKSDEEDRESDWFMTVLFPSSQLQILPYNRAVRDLNGLGAEAFLARIKGICAVNEGGPATPVRRGECSMLLGGRWYSLNFAGICRTADPVESLDVSILQRHILDGVLGIKDPRTSDRIDFVGGIRGTGELERMVAEGRAAVAFSMYPVGIDQVIAVSDAGMIMAPKCTWFEPKLRSGLLVHMLDR